MKQCSHTPFRGKPGPPPWITGQGSAAPDGPEGRRGAAARRRHMAAIAPRIGAGRSPSRQCSRGVHPVVRASPFRLAIVWRGAGPALGWPCQGGCLPMTLLPTQPVTLRRSRWRLTLVGALTVLTTGSLIAAANTGAAARGLGHPFFSPGNLLVSGSVYVKKPGTIVPGVTVLPHGCTSGCVTANSNAAYPGVWNNDSVDPSFGITSPIFLEQLTPSGQQVNTLSVPPPGNGKDGVATSFSSKSEMALNLSASGRYVTFMGYMARPNAIDVSNSNTPGDVDPTNPVPGKY